MRMRTSISKPLIFVVISVLVIGTLDLSYSTDTIAVPRDPGSYGSDCESYGYNHIRCCWTETEEDDPEQIEIYKCQLCRVSASGWLDCQPSRPDPRPAPTTGENISPGITGGLEQPPTPPPSGPAAPPQGGIVEELEEQPTQPLPSPPTAGESVIPGDTGVLQQPPSEGGVTQRGCQSNVVTTCLPCDLGLPGASCIPASEWPPDAAQLEQGEGAAPPFVPGFLERQQLQPPPADQGAIESPQPAIPTQPATEEEEPVPPCPEGQVIDEETDLCVLEEPETQETEEQQGSEENGSEDNTNN